MQLTQDAEGDGLADRLRPVNGSIADLADRVGGLGHTDADCAEEPIIRQSCREVIAVGLVEVLQVVDPRDDLLDDAPGVEHRRARVRAPVGLGAHGVRVDVGPLGGEEVEVGGHGDPGSL